MQHTTQPSDKYIIQIVVDDIHQLKITVDWPETLHGPCYMAGLLDALSTGQFTQQLSQAIQHSPHTEDSINMVLQTWQELHANKELFAQMPCIAPRDVFKVSDNNDGNK
jgi:hypothetical protein